MNKQELNEKVKSLVSFNSPHGKDFEWGFDDCRHRVLSLIQALDEPQKVKVNQYVAEWYEEHKHNLSNSLWEFTAELNEKTLVTGAIYTEFESWFIDHPRAYEVITSMENGYEVEEEPKYYVNIGDLYLKEPLGDTSDFTISMTWNREYAYPFDSWNMAREHASELGGTVEKVEE